MRPRRGRVGKGKGEEEGEGGLFGVDFLGRDGRGEVGDYTCGM